MNLNPEVQKRLQQYFRQLNWIFIGFLSGVLLLGLGISIAFIFGFQATQLSYQDALLWGGPISGFALALLSHKLFTGRLNTAKTQNTLYHKMEGYRSAHLLRMITLDGAAFLNLLGYALTGKLMLLGVALAIIFIFITQKPSLERMIKDLELSEVEQQVLRDHF